MAAAGLVATAIHGDMSAAFGPGQVVAAKQTRKDTEAAQSTHGSVVSGNGVRRVAIKVPYVGACTTVASKSTSRSSCVRQMM